MYHAPENLGGGTAYHYALQQEHQGISQYLQTLGWEHQTRKKQQDLEHSLQELRTLQSSLHEDAAQVRALEEKEDKQSSELDDVKREQQQHRGERVIAQQLKNQLDRMQLNDQHQHQKLQEMENVYAALNQDYQQRVRIEEEKRGLRSDNRLRIFYEKVERTLNQLFGL